MLNKTILIGNGSFTPSPLFTTLASNTDIVAVDGGVNICREHSIFPQAIIGDLDSATPENLEYFKKKGSKVLHIPEQHSTDFEKALRTLNSDIYYCFGFTGGLFDHDVSLLHILQKNPEKKICICTEDQVFFVLPSSGNISISVGKRVSFYPLSPVRFHTSKGLQYRLDGLTLEQGTCIGTSNQSIAQTVSWEIDFGCCLGFFPIECFGNILLSWYGISLD